MFVLTDTTSGGIYAIKSKDRKKTVTVFEDRDDALDKLALDYTITE